MCCWLTFEPPRALDTEASIDSDADLPSGAVEHVPESLGSQPYMRRAAPEVRPNPCVSVPRLLELTSVNPSAVHVSAEHRHKHGANHCNHGCNDSSAVSAEAGGAHQESARYSTTNTHEDVHKRTIPITLKNPSRSPTDDRPNQNPCD